MAAGLLPAGVVSASRHMTDGCVVYCSLKLLNPTRDVSTVGVHQSPQLQVSV